MEVNPKLHSGTGQFGVGVGVGVGVGLGPGFMVSWASFASGAAARHDRKETAVVGLRRRRAAKDDLVARLVLSALVSSSVRKMSNV